MKEKNKAAVELGRMGGIASVKSRFRNLTKEQISDTMRKVRNNKLTKKTMKQNKGLIKFEGKTYWLDLGTEDGGFECKVKENGKWRPVGKTEIDLFDLMETGKVIGDKKE